jgi:hypothetical protein
VLAVQATAKEAETEGIVVQSRTAGLEAELLEALSGNSTRSQDKIDEETNEIIETCVAKLEKDGGLPNPTRDASINGRWRLLYTTRPGTSSPVQRAFTGIDSFRIYQDVLLTRVNGPQVNNVVVFGDSGELKVEAQAVTDALPLEGFVPRQKPGLSFLGQSSSAPAKGPNSRIDFQFTRAGFKFNVLDQFLVKFPYPVPFRLLKDEAKGWLDITYLSPEGNVRIARGNKGTLFILKKEPTQTEELQTLIEQGEDEQVASEVEKMIADTKANPSKQSAADTLEYLEGEWKLRWTSQSQNASGIQKFATSFDNFQVISRSTAGASKKIDTLENVAKFLPFLVLRAKAECAQDQSDKSKFNVSIEGAKVQVGPLEIPLGFIKGQGWLQVLYVDEDIRISRGSKGSLFVHNRSNLL